MNYYESKQAQEVARGKGKGLDVCCCYHITVLYCTVLADFGYTCSILTAFTAELTLSDFEVLCMAFFSPCPTFCYKRLGNINYIQQIVFKTNLI